MFRATVERLPALETLAAWEVHTAVRAPHHVLTFERRMLCSALDLLLIAFQNPVQECKARHEQQYFGQPAIRL
jgi:hypothetical protein